jgi:hypothetical protein
MPAKAGIQSRNSNSSQVIPSGIVLFYQPKFPRPFPFLNPLFAQNGFTNIAVDLEPNQCMDTILLRKTVGWSVAMLVNPPVDIVGHTSVERAVSRTSHDVDEIAMFSRHAVGQLWMPAFAGMTV